MTPRVNRPRRCVLPGYLQDLRREILGPPRHAEPEPPTGNVPAAA
jgi:hypothetical protein